MSDTPKPRPFPRYGCNNPYKIARKMFKQRLAWDFTWEAHRSKRILRSCKNRHFGGKAVIVCNGPSLLKNDLGSLSEVFTFGLNKINLLFDKNAFRPSAVVAVNAHVLEQNAAFFNETELPLFLDFNGRHLVKPRPNVAFLHTVDTLMFARDCSMSLCQGYTVTGTALQLAFHYGFRDVALIGCDHNFATKGPPNLAVVSGKTDESHFDPRYFSGGQVWQLPDLVASEHFYVIARETFSAVGGRVINATEGGKLEVFERMSLADWLRSPAPTPIM